MNVAAVVLAAGFSRRLGRSKQNVRLGGETLLGRALRTATEAGCSPVVAVLREGMELAPVEGVTFVTHTEAAEGMAASIRHGVAAAEKFEVAGVVLLTCDQVALTSEHLRALCGEPNTITGSAYGGRVGVPAYFPRAAFAALQALRGDSGARELLRGARSLPAEALALDIDTEEDLRGAEAWMARG